MLLGMSRPIPEKSGGRLQIVAFDSRHGEEGQAQRDPSAAELIERIRKVD